jgi:hypothetical protein
VLLASPYVFFGAPAQGSAFQEMTTSNSLIHGIRARSIVVLDDGKTEHIRKLHTNDYRGKVLSLVDGKVKACNVTGTTRWARSRHTEFLNIVTSSSPASNSGGFQGPDLAPDHPVITQFGPVAARALQPGVHRIITATPTANSQQMSIIVGSLLGDGGFYEQFGSKANRKRSPICGFWFSQTSPRHHYATWKHDILRSLAPGSNLIITPATGKHGENWRYALNYTPYFNYLRYRFPRKTRSEHGNRKLVITDDVFDHLGPLGLAVWYMDDGSSYNGIQANLTASKLEDYEIETSERRLYEMLGEDVPYRRSSKGFYFSRKAFESLRDLIGRFIHPAVAYKMPGAGLAPYAVDPTPGPVFEEEIVEVRTVIREGKFGDNTRFSLVVPEPNNFLTLSGFVSC